MAQKLDLNSTMQDLLNLVLDDPELSETRRRNLASSIRSFIKYLGLDLHMQADFPTYRGHLKRFNLGSAPISRARWANIVSDVKYALQKYGARTRAPSRDDLHPEWLVLVPRLDSLRLQRGLSRLVHWCSKKGTMPEEVDDAVMASFHQHLIEETFEQKPDKIYRDTCKLWNDAAASVDSWPKKAVTLPSFRQLVSRPLEEFPVSFRADLERYRQRAAGLDLTAADFAEKPLKPSTIDHHLKLLRRFASAMVRARRPIEEITDIAALLDLAPFKAAMQSEFERLGGPKPSLQELSGTLVAIAKHYVQVPEAHLEELKRVKRRLRCRPRGFTDKNRDRLRPFADGRNQARFLGLTDKLIKLAQKAKSEVRAARLIQTALVHELMIMAPMRFCNLAKLNIHEHLRFSGPGRSGKVIIAIPGHEVKNGQDLEFELPLPTAQLLKLYLRKYRHLLLKTSDLGWLFPGKARGGRKHQVSLGEQLWKAVKKHTGLTVNPHLYRHIAAYFYLQDHPTDYETVKRLLGHTSMETTTMFYADFERGLSQRYYTEHVLERRNRLNHWDRSDRKGGAEALP